MLIKSYLKFSIRVGLVSLISFGVARSADAYSFTLTNGSSSAMFDNTAPNSGFTSWIVNGLDQIGNLNTATFIRASADTNVLTTFCGNDSFAYIETGGCLDTPTVTTQGTNKITLSYIYQECIPNGQSCTLTDIFKVDLTYTLGLKSLTQKVDITNLSTDNSLDFDIVNYYNLNVNGNPADSLTPSGQTSGTALQYDDPTQAIGSVYAQTTTNPSKLPDYSQTSSDPSTFINDIAGLGAGNLNYNSNPLTGDIAQAYQFSYFNVSQNATVSSQQTIGILEVPEPSTLLGLGSLGLSLFGRKGIKKAKDLLGNLKA